MNSFLKKKAIDIILKQFHATLENCIDEDTVLVELLIIRRQCLECSLLLYAISMSSILSNGPNVNNSYGEIDNKCY